MAKFACTWLLLLGLWSVGHDAAPTDLQTLVEQLHEKLANIETELDAYIGTNSSESDRLQQLESLLTPLRVEISEVDHDLMKPALVKRLEAVQDTVTENLQLDRIERMLATHFKDFRPDQNSTDDRKPIVYTDCKTAYEDGWVRSGVYRIKPNGRKEMEVYCEQEKYGGGWVVIQSRLNGNEDFYRPWQDYKDGFGDLHGDHWLGNDNINQLTLGEDQNLKVELQHEGYFAYADYSSFSIGDEDIKYKLKVSGFADTNYAGDSLTPHNGLYFTTRDRDNDNDPRRNRAVHYKGAWWYIHNARFSNLNGLYGDTNYRWHTWVDHRSPMAATRMMIKTK